MLHVQNVHLGSWGTGGYLISLLTIGLFRWTKIIVHVQNVHIGIGGDLHRVRQAGAGGWSWNAVREKYC